uniref:Uncharacterized protein n=1 Tax=viral metagenome TaxID=1070528 RepID=A0A6C0K1F4_9ZZZZ
MALNAGDLKMYEYYRKSEDNSGTWKDVPDLVEVHEAERLKDSVNHSEYLKREKSVKVRMKAKNKYMQKNSEMLLRQNIKPRINVKVQTQPSRAEDPSIDRPGIGLLGKGEKNDYDVYDTEFHGGKKKKTRRNRKNKRAKRSRKTKNQNLSQARKATFSYYSK